MAIKEWSATDEQLLSKMPEPETEPKLYLRAVIYGDPGMGKTVVSCSLGRTLVLTADDGWVSIKNHPDIWKNVEVRPFVGYRQLETIARAIYHQKEPYNQFDTFVIDPLTVIQEEYVDLLVRAGKFNKDTRPIYTIKDRSLASDILVTELPGVDDYHAVKNLLRESINVLNRSPVNVIFVCHERDPLNNPQQTKEKEIRPDLTEALYKIIVRRCHLVGRATKAGDKRVLDFISTPRQSGKSRIGILNDKKILQEDFPSFIKKWQGAKWDVPSFRIEI